jgi:glycogen phosphorylase
METFRDPVCGMMVREGEGFSVAYQGEKYHFCSEFCQRSFQAKPEKYRPRPHVEGAVDVDTSRRIAYFSMEVAVDSRMPNYSGGLGVLAGDTLKSCADLKVPAVAVSLMYKNGYFQQRLDEWGNDTNTEENTPEDRELSAWLYGGDDRYRLAQEVVLGIGGVRMLRALGYTALERFHMNEGHAALLVVELLRESRNSPDAAFDFDAVRKRCVFTTHTPVPAGHDHRRHAPDHCLQRLVLQHPPHAAAIHGQCLCVIEDSPGLVVLCGRGAGRRSPGLRRGDKDASQPGNQVLGDHR